MGASLVQPPSIRGNPPPPPTQLVIFSCLNRQLRYGGKLQQDHGNRGNLRQGIRIRQVYVQVQSIMKNMSVAIGVYRIVYPGSQKKIVDNSHINLPKLQEYNFVKHINKKLICNKTKIILLSIIFDFRFQDGSGSFISRNGSVDPDPNPN